MNVRNDGNASVNGVQNRFTAYLSTAVKRKKFHYMEKLIRQSNHEVSIDDLEHDDISPEVDMLAGLSPLVQLQDHRLLQALLGLTARERYVLLAHILNERQFNELEEDLGFGYKGVTAIYYRAIQKVQRKMRGDMG